MNTMVTEIQTSIIDSCLHLERSLYALNPNDLLDQLEQHQHGFASFLKKNNEMDKHKIISNITKEEMELAVHLTLAWTKLIFPVVRTIVKTTVLVLQESGYEVELVPHPQVEEIPEMMFLLERMKWMGIRIQSASALELGVGVLFIPMFLFCLPFWILVFCLVYGVEQWAPETAVKGWEIVDNGMEVVHLSLKSFRIMIQRQKWDEKYQKEGILAVVSGALTSTWTWGKMMWSNRNVVWQLGFSK